MFSILITGFLFTNEATPLDEKFAGRDSMNNIKMSSYRNFENKWKLVTVRYRKDTGEQRFVYANKIALKTLLSGSTKYPDGAVFAKIGFKTQEDPAFPSSEVPNGTRRFQFMVRDKNLYKKTSGWGYALFDSSGKTFPENPSEMVTACASCHQLVENKGYVFSEMLITNPKVAPQGKVKTFKLVPKFITLTEKNLPDFISKQLPPKTIQVQSLEGNLKEHMFQGTLDEIKPTLIKEALRTGTPTILFNSKSNRFSLIYFSKEKKCPETEVAITSITTKKDPAGSLIIQHFCTNIKNE